jgi:hypothetical protein
MNAAVKATNARGASELKGVTHYIAAKLSGDKFALELLARACANDARAHGASEREIGWAVGAAIRRSR